MSFSFYQSNGSVSQEVIIFIIATVKNLKLRLMQSDLKDPLEIGSNSQVTDFLTNVVCCVHVSAVSGVWLTEYNPGTWFRFSLHTNRSGRDNDLFINIFLGRLHNFIRPTGLMSLCNCDG